MNIILLDGSPKAKDSASAHILKHLEGMLPETSATHFHARSRENDVLLSAAMDSDAIVIAFPPYVDGVPGHLLRLLSEQLEPGLSGKRCGAMVYAAVNSGFFEARQNRIALEMIKCWAQKSGLQWGQGVGIGSGPMLQAAPLGYGPSANAGKALTALVENILQKRGGENLFADPNFPRFLYKTMAHLGWRKDARRFGISAKELYAKREQVSSRTNRNERA